MIDRINQRRRGHIVTIEDPIEFQHQHRGCLVNQREIGRDSKSFKIALKYILRQDPDVVLVGEMRDIETVEAALAIAETGHLCLASLHTNTAIQSINRIIDVFPAHQHSQVRAVLSFVLEGVVTQALLPKASGSGRVLVSEVMVPNPAIRNLIREDKLHQVYSQMQIGQAKYGMQTLNQSLLDQYMKKNINIEETLGHSSEVDELKTMILNAGGSLGAYATASAQPKTERK
jgi:twitching motility protein PilT